MEKEINAKLTKFDQNMHNIDEKLKSQQKSGDIIGVGYIDNNKLKIGESSKSRTKKHE